MKRILILFVLLLAALGLSAQVTGLTDGWVSINDGDYSSNVGQDIGIKAGPVSLDLTADWARAVGGADTLAVTYALAFSKAFGAFTPGLKLTGDQTYALDSVAVQSGDYFSDLIPSLGIVLGKFGADLYSDLSFEKGYNLLQTFDGSAYFKAKTFTLRAGILYADAQAVTDDENYPNAPAIREGVSFYAKASISY
jgi:hypothetical protein